MMDLKEFAEKSSGPERFDRLDKAGEDVRRPEDRVTCADRMTTGLNSCAGFRIFQTMNRVVKNARLDFIV
jgi:hypothetical protein